MRDIFYIGSRPNLFPHEREVCDVEDACRQSRTRYLWIVSYLADYSDWDWLWEPPPWQIHQRHVWPSQWQRNSGTMLVPKSGYQDTNYHQDRSIQMRASGQRWHIPKHVDSDSVDQSWHPDADEPSWIYHFASQHQHSSGVTYTCDGAKDIKFDTTMQVQSRADQSQWQIPDWIDPDSIDYSWHPDSLQPAYIYHFASQHQAASGVTYTVPGATSIKLCRDITVRSVPVTEHWRIPDWIDSTSLDYSWHPDALEPSWIYHFATTQAWDRVGGPEYHQPGAHDRKYSDAIVAVTRGDPTLWHIPEWIDPDSIDRTWCPHPEDPAMTYEFPVEWGWNRVGGPQYRVPGAEQIKYVTDFVARTLPGPDLCVQDRIADDDAVRRWRPNPADPAYIYVFGNQWWPAEQRASAEYHIPGAQERKFMSAPRAHRLPVTDNYRVMIDSDFDFSWEPDPGDPAYIYVFGNQWWPAEKMPTIEYHVPGAQERKFMSQPRARLQENPCDHWRPLEDCDWDSSWRPDPGDPAYIYVFGNQWYPAEIWPTLEYCAPGAQERKYVDWPRAQLKTDRTQWTVFEGIDPDSVDYTWQPDPGSPPYIYEFGTQWQKTGGARYTVPGATEVKYSPAFRCHKTSHDPNWHMPQDLATIIEDFDWTWHPDSTEEAYIYEFGSQHQKTGGPEYHVPGAVQRKYVDQVRVTVRESRARAVIIDHIDDNARAVHEQILTSVGVMKTVRYVTSYLDTLKRIAAQVDEEWIWVVSSVCDYAKFDFTWYPEQWQATMLHVFASDDLKFGDTFFMHVPTFRERAGRAQLLEWYDVNFVERSVPRRVVPVVQHADDTHVDAIRSYITRAPVTLFTTTDVPIHVPALNLWRNETKAVIPLDSSASRVLIPREAISAVITQVYDYAIIDKTHISANACEPLDIVFISNGEANADQNWGALLHSKQGAPNRCVRVDGINGRAAAYHAAAEASETGWFFAVFAKLQVLDNFDWSWQPDRLQQPKHYIFHALNPVNMLEYGHQAMIAYNRRLTLANPGRGLDFTLDDAHEVVPILSGVAHYNVDAWTAWRTAFREVIKLRASLPDIESEYRIKQWLSKGAGPNGVFSCHGAQDAIDYFDEVNGELTELRKSYEWSWLASYALLKRNLVIG
jgi:hypothetical protein